VFLKSIRRVYLEEEARDYEMARRILARLPGVPVEVIKAKRALLGGDGQGPEIPGPLSQNPSRGVEGDLEVGERCSPSPPLKTPAAADPAAWLAAAKGTLLLGVQKGPFWRPCPGTRDYLCCGYQVLQVTLNCPFDCAYCVLQAYVNVPAVVIFVNAEDLLAELEARFAQAPDKVVRLGTGEFGDSLALDGLMGLNRRLIPVFSRHPKVLLEIKSKWHRLEHLLDLGPDPNIVFAWSLNPGEIVREAEAGSASLSARLKAARSAVAAGFRVAFHFDPLIHFSGWQAAYRRTVDLLGRAVAPEAIAWISLGSLRFLPSLRRLIHRRFPETRLAAGEMVLAPDGKLRYFKSLRVEMYGLMREWLTAAAPGALVYLCMESPRVWREVFGFSPAKDDLAKLLDERVAG
jgi:spore photoproduct lyase